MAAWEQAWRAVFSFREGLLSVALVYHQLAMALKALESRLRVDSAQDPMFRSRSLKLCPCYIFVTVSKRRNKSGQTDWTPDCSRTNYLICNVAFQFLHTVECSD